MGVDQEVRVADREARLRAVLDVAVTSPVAARGAGGRWSEATAAAYLAVMTHARGWWETTAATARASARGAGIAIPSAAAPRFMPWPSERLAEYVGHLAQEGRAPATIRKAIAAIRAVHRVYGLPLPDGAAALVVLGDHERTLAAAGWEPKRAEPITLAGAVRLLAGLDRTAPRGRRDAAVLFLAFGGMLTPAMMAALLLRSVAEHPDGLAVVRQAGDDPLVLAHWRIAGEHHPDVCPVEAVLGWSRYLRDRDARGWSPLLRPVDQWGNVAGVDDRYAGVLVDDTGRLDPAALSGILHAIADRAGLPPEQHPTMTELRLGGIVRRRLDGATVDELAAESGVASLLGYVAEAERRRAAAGGAP
jgi:hypothetical protein